jgi:hypothetical protein
MRDTTMNRYSAARPTAARPAPARGTYRAGPRIRGAAIRPRAWTPAADLDGLRAQLGSLVETVPHALSPACNVLPLALGVGRQLSRRS